MDARCNCCSEPWAWYHIKDEVLPDDKQFNRAMTAGTKTRGFDLGPGCYIRHCPACPANDYGARLSVTDRENAKIRESISELLGDDIDGYLAMCEDFGL